MGKKRKGKSKKLNVPANQTEPEEVVKAPHSFIFHRGLVGKHIHHLLKDMRHVMEPYTASHLKARKRNSLKDFVATSGVLHVSHMVIFTQTVISPYMRIIKVPRGPTLTFKIHSYTHSNDVLSSLKKQYAFNKIFLNPPLVVLNGFVGDEPHMKLMVATFQGMFPTINVTTVNLKNISRCVLFNYNSESKTIDFRHYVVRAVPVGISKAVKKLGRNKIPDLSRFSDVSEFMMKADILSDSEVEDDPNNKFNLPQNVGPRATKGNQAAVRLTEYGPRISLQLIKVEDGVMEGEVLYHEYVQKTEEEKELIKKRLEEKRKLKEKRRREQMANVKRKQQEKEEAKRKSLEGMKKVGVKVGSEAGGSQQEGVNNEEDDDAEWYRKEVGAEPEPELFQKRAEKSILKRKAPGDDSGRPVKKPRTGMKIRWSSDVKSTKPDFNKGGKGGLKQPNRRNNKKKGGRKGGAPGRKVIHNKARRQGPGTKVKGGKRQR